MRKIEFCLTFLGKQNPQYFSYNLLPSEKGFYAFAFLLSLFGTITLQKNTRDSQVFNKTRICIDPFFKRGVQKVYSLVP
ncbi:YiaA/YiaB family inner membrane protein [Pedobacter chinensis]|uniref:YiaA/YiaB family inner membrane protein n=1 Tax=Pedobacter chinensis TaxID=2282421 RepID=UPI001F332AF6|nr:YiaA/YiaB family inner membrane protein [Pedobacter chinensis]